MATVTVSIWTAWLISMSYLFISTATVCANSSSNLRSSLFSLITCPSTATAACATKTTPAESYNGVSLGQCSNACNRINGCSYYNYIEPDDPDKCGGGQCELFTNQKMNISSKALCKLFKVSYENWSISRSSWYIVQTFMWKTEHFTLCVEDKDTTKTANIKIGVLHFWHIFNRTRTIAMFNLKFKIVSACDFCDRNPL